MLFILQIVGSAPGFPHGIIDPIVVCSFSLVSFSCFLYARTKTINRNLNGISQVISDQEDLVI